MQPALFAASTTGLARADPLGLGLAVWQAVLKLLNFGNLSRLKGEELGIFFPILFDPVYYLYFFQNDSRCLIFCPTLGCSRVLFLVLTSANETECQNLLFNNLVMVPHYEDVTDTVCETMSAAACREISCLYKTLHSHSFVRTLELPISVRCELLTLPKLMLKLQRGLRGGWLPSEFSIATTPW